MKKYQPNKHLGQHFLMDRGLVEKISSNHEGLAEITLEVGPGPGALTKSLKSKEKNLYVLEKDSRFLQSLQEILPSEQIFLGDALHYPLEKIIPRDKTARLVSNLPYNISSQLFLRFLQYPQIKYMTLMFQKEVGEKTVNIPQKKSSLNCLSQNFFESSILSRVPPGAFSPQPRVDSIVISYKRKDSPEIPLREFSSFEGFLRELFKFKRKQMLSILKKTYPDLKWEPILEKYSIDIKTRAEALSHEAIQNLYKEFSSWE